MQTRTWHFRGTLHKSADPLTWVIGVSLDAVITQVHMVSTCSFGCILKAWHMGANMDLAFSGTLYKLADPLTLVIGVSLGAVITQVRMVSTSISLICCASLK